MKRHLIILTAMLVCGVMQAQQFEPIVAEGKQWNVAFSYPWFPPEPQHHYTTAYKVEGDTVVEGTAYKMLLYTRSEHFTNWAFCGVLRETNEGQVFYRGYGNHVFGDEEMLYDFSMQPGDSIQYYDESESYLVLVSVSDTLMENDYMPRKKFVLQYKEEGYLWDGYYETWIEGIGSLFGLLNPGSLFLVGGWDNLLCYYEDGDLLFQNPDFNSCYMGTDGVDENEVENLVAVYPNPASGVVRIEGIEAEEVWLYNALGQVVKRVRNSNEVSLEGLVQGVYLLRIADAEGRNHVARVAVK